MQNKRNYQIKDNDNVELLLTHIKKMQNITKVKVLVIDKTALLTKVAIDKKRQMSILEKYKLYNKLI